MLLLVEEHLSTGEHLVHLRALLDQAVQDLHQEGISFKLHAVGIIVVRVFYSPFIPLTTVADELLGEGMEVEKELVFDHGGSDLVVHALEEDLDGISQLIVRKLDRVFLTVSHLEWVEVLHLIGVLAEVVE
jgi:hypothetical protein